MQTQKKPEHESKDTIENIREISYRAPSPDSEPPGKEENDGKDEETDGVASSDLPEPGVEDLDEEQSRRHSA